MADSSLVTLRLDSRILDALDSYVPSELEGRAHASRKARYALVSYLQERGSPLELPRVSCDFLVRRPRGPRPTTGRRRRRRR